MTNYEWWRRRGRWLNWLALLLGLMGAVTATIGLVLSSTAIVTAAVLVAVSGFGLALYVRHRVMRHS